MWTSTAHIAILWFFVLFTPTHSFRYTIGAILRQKEDAHLRAALNFAVHWINDHHPELGNFGLRVQSIQPGDHYGAIQSTCRLLEKEKIFGLFAPADNALASQLTRLTDSVDLPLYTVTDSFAPSGVQTVELKTHRLKPIWGTRIELFPREQLYEALSDLIKHWRWTRVVVVYAEIERVTRLISYLEKEQYASIRFEFVRVESGRFLEATTKIKKLKECDDVQEDCAEFRRIMVDMNPQDSYSFFLAALQTGFIELKHWFLLTSMDLQNMDMELFRHNHARFIAVDLVSPEFQRIEREFNFNEFKQQIISNWTFENENTMALKMSEAILAFDGVYLAARSLSNMSQEYPIKTDLHTTRCRTTTRGYVPYRYGRKLIDEIKNNTMLGLSSDLSREPISDVNVNMSQDSRAQLQDNVKVSDELKPHFRVTTIMERPYVMLKKNHFELDQNSQFEGFCIDLLHELSNDLGFTYTLHIVKDGQYGSVNNGSWNGLIGELLRGEADMVVAPFTANFRRAEVVDFTKPFLSLGISILFKIPTDQQPDFFSFLNPLSLEIWVSVLASIFGLSVGIVAQISPGEWNFNFSCCTAHQPHCGAKYEANESVELSNNYSFWNTLWYVCSTMLKGGCDFGPRAMSTRMLGAAWWLFTLVVVSAYTANLAAVLTVSKPHIPIRSLDDLVANQTSILYGTIKGGSTMQFFQESKIPSHVKMWKTMMKQEKQVFVSSNRAGVEKVLTQNYAYLMESTSLEYETQQNCNLTQIGGVLGSKGYGIALQKKSEWTDRISRQILLYQKRGVIEMKKQKWWRSKGAACQGVGSAVNQQRVSLSLYNVFGLFIILFSGLFFSAIAVLLEFFVRSRKVSKAEIKEEIRFGLGLSNSAVDHRTRKERAHRQQSNNTEETK
ncbi:hypothetical protein M3Y98_00638000 [Aphelenchoides besseyi]|nr:hypothetical protein M3Y98_00638000 [Aphelenchoides besseyi]